MEQQSGNTYSPITPCLVSVCLCTYKRAHLRDTLESLAKLELPAGVSLEIIVADNDAAGSGRAIVDEIKAQIDFPLQYEIEPEPGISHARNRTLAMAKGDWFAFVDDDELVEPDWISAHLNLAERLEADVLIGLVKPKFGEGTPGWFKESGIYEHERQLGATGNSAKIACTSNAFVRAKPVRDANLRFDPAYGFSGAEDNDFFLRLGLPAICNREAVVWETLPSDRLSMPALERRAQAFGKAQMRMTWQHKGVWAAIHLSARSFFRVTAGTILMGLLYPFDQGRSRFYRIVTIKNLAKLGYFVRGRLPKIYG